MSEKVRQKIYITDTNVHIVNPNVIDELGNNVIVVPIWVIREIDSLKRSKPHLEFAVREVSRNLEKYRQRGKEQGTFLSDGVRTPAGGTLFVDFNSQDLSKLGHGVENTVDNRVLLAAMHWKEKEEREEPNPELRRPVIVLSQDTNVRIQADVYRIAAEDWRRERLISSVDDLYTGRATISLSVSKAGLLTEMFTKKSLPVEAIADEYELKDLIANQCCRLVCGAGTPAETSSLAIYKAGKRVFIPVKKPVGKVNGWKNNIQPVNDEQALAYALMMDESIDLVTLTGGAGTGKTLMALLAGYRQFKEGKVKQIKVWRPMEPLGKEMGYLPGTQEEKFAPWARPIYAAFSLVVGDDGKPDYDKNTVGIDELVVESFSHARGTTEPNTFLIIDECQNLTPHEAKTLLTRVGFDTKIVLTGDVEQVDNRFLDSISNGLTYTVQCWKGSERAAHVTLVKSERSAFVEEAIKRMS